MTPFQNLEYIQLVTSHIRNLRNREINKCLAKVICLHTWIFCSRNTYWAPGITLGIQVRKGE